MSVSFCKRGCYSEGKGEKRSVQDVTENSSDHVVEIETLETAIDAANKVLLSLETNCNALASDIISKLVLASDGEIELAHLIAVQSSWIDKKSTIEHALGESITEVEKRTQNQTEIEATVSELNKPSGKNKSMANNDASKAARLEGELRRLKGEITSLKGRIEPQEAEITQLDDQIKECQVSIDHKIQAVQSQNEDVNNLRDRLVAARAGIRDRRSEVNDLIDNLGALGVDVSGRELSLAHVMIHRIVEDSDECVRAFPSPNGSYQRVRFAADGHIKHLARSYSASSAFTESGAWTLHRPMLVDDDHDFSREVLHVGLGIPTGVIYVCGCRIEVAVDTAARRIKTVDVTTRLEVELIVHDHLTIEIRIVNTDGVKF